jgi:hypothetical protein
MRFQPWNPFFATPSLWRCQPVTVHCIKLRMVSGGNTPPVYECATIADSKGTSSLSMENRRDFEEMREHDTYPPKTLQ